MPPSIDERYAFLAVEDKKGLIPSLFEKATTARPNIGMLDLPRLLRTYGYDIITLALSSDSPLSSSLPSNFEQVIEASWRFMNKVWALREFCDLWHPGPGPDINQYHKAIALAHTKINSLHKNFINSEYGKVLDILMPAAPNLVEEIREVMLNKQQID